MPRRTSTAAALASVLLLLPLPGCTLPSIVTSQACASWVDFTTPVDAADEADAVALGRIVDQAGNTTYEGITTNTWNVEVDEWLKGDGEGEIIVTSLPRTCGDDRDTMSRFQSVEELVLFLRDDESGWQTITPFQGAVPASPDGEIPEAWPDGLYD